MRFVWLLTWFSFTAVAEELSPQRRQALLEMLKHDCGSCHGLPPKGGLGPSLMADALAGKSDAYLVDTIQNGRAGSAMPPWRQFLTADETDWLVKQLRQQGWK